MLDRNNVPRRRIELGMMRPPCGECPKLPPGFFRRCKPEQAAEPWKWAADITDDVYAALQYHRECEAVAVFPDNDGWSRPAAAAIAAGIRQAERTLLAREIAGELERLMPRPEQDEPRTTRRRGMA